MDISNGDIQWYRDAVIYQLHVKSFLDANGDGVGDFVGLIEKIDYIVDLGVNTIWLLPFYPSPLRDDGYDIAGYTDVHPAYGTLSNVVRFIDEAHARGLRIITELVINHTSDQHPWFQRARRAEPGSIWRNFYVWSDSPKKYKQTRIIFCDTEKSNWTWDAEAQAYYWHRFFSHQPDLNFDNPQVLDEVTEVMRFWLDLGVDGLRLDAVPYLCEREGTNNENLPETHAVLKRLRAWLDQHYPDRMFLAEANQWPEDVRAYFGDGDECHMAFHFPLMPRMYMALAREDRYPITDILRQTPPIPSGCQWATFLRNHDELTLEMVTDRERDYLWQFYAADPRARINLGIRRRLATLLQGDGRKIRLLNALLMSIPGTPIVYYGDEIGMGDNVYLGDRNGVRTPMQWSPDRNAGFSRADAEKLSLPVIMDPVFGYAATNVEAQSRLPSSLLNWMRRLLQVRSSQKTLGRGDLVLLYPGNRKILAFLRSYEGETILCVANVAQTVQSVQLDLSAYAGRIPIELLDRSALPPIGSGFYFLTLTGYGFFWLLLAEEGDAPKWYASEVAPLPEFQTFVLTADLGVIFQQPKDSALLSGVLSAFLPNQRWFAGKGRAISTVAVNDLLVLGEGRGRVLVIFVQVTFEREERQRYCLPLAISWESIDFDPLSQLQPFVLAKIRQGARVGVLHDAFATPDFAHAVLAAFKAGSEVALQSGGKLVFSTTSAFEPMRELADLPIDPLGREQSNTSVAFGDQMMLKFFRRVEPGVHPEVEIGRFLTEVAGYANTPQMLGAAYVEADGAPPSAFAVLQQFVRNQGDGWSFTLEYLQRHLRDYALAPDPELPPDDHAIYLTLARTLSQRLAELHCAFAIASEDPAFRPEPVTDEDIERWQREVLVLAEQARAYIIDYKDSDAVAPERHAQAVRLLDEWADVVSIALPEGSRCGMKTRHHGDFHLGQTVVVNEDFYILDFEGEPLRSLEQRRGKHSPLRDLAGLICSFDYASRTALRQARHTHDGGGALAAVLNVWKDQAVTAAREGYRDAASSCRSLPADPAVFDQLLTNFVLEKTLYEICYEATNRPDWLEVPIGGLADLVFGSRAN